MYKIVKSSATSTFETKLNEEIANGFTLKHFTAVEAGGGSIWLIALVYKANM